MAVKQVQWHNHTLTISYEIVNPDAKRDFIVLHGWGSHKELMRDAFKSYLPTFRHIYIDLPGFGNSTSTAPMNSFDYAEIMELFIEAISAKRDIIMGHSFGGKVATLLNPDMLVLLSSAGIKEAKPLKIHLKIALFKMLKTVGFAKLRHLFVANDAKLLDKHMYETFKRVIAEDFSAIFARFTKKCLIFWGTRDTATKLESGKRIHLLIKDSIFKAFQGDHYFFLQNSAKIAHDIEQRYIHTKED